MGEWGKGGGLGVRMKRRYRGGDGVIEENGGGLGYKGGRGGWGYE